MEQQFGSKEREESCFPLFEDVVKAVKDGTIDYGVLPIENSSTGGITESTTSSRNTTVPSSESSW